MNVQQNKHIGKKILYVIVIGMSGLILLLSAIGILGVWLIQRPLSDTTISLLHVVETSAKVIRASGDRVDQALAAFETQIQEIATASDQLSHNVIDKGMVMVLLREEKEQQLMKAAASIRATYQSVRGSIALGLDVYRSLNRLPFVSLPGPDEDQMDKVETSITGLQEKVKIFRSEIADFRTGVASKIDKVTATAILLNNDVSQTRNNLAQLDARLAALEALSIHLQKIIPAIFLTMAVILTLILGFLIFTQVEVIRLYVNRWQQLGDLQNIPVVDVPAQSS